MIKRIFSFIMAAILGFALLAGCAAESEYVVPENTPGTYAQIRPAEAKEIMDNAKYYIILDVRTQEEFDEGHIPGAILLPSYEVGEKAESVLADKSQLILVYCRSGRRSKNAASELAALGYTNIKEFGGIIDWPYETVVD